MRKSAGCSALKKSPARRHAGRSARMHLIPSMTRLAKSRRILAGLGLNEAQGQTLIGKSEVRSQKPEEIVALANPLSSDMDVLEAQLIARVDSFAAT